MKFMQSVDINKPLSEVIEFFSNRSNRRYWMGGFVSSVLLSGDEGQPGAKSKMEFMVGNKKIEITETILINKLPEEFTCTYESQGVFNTVKCMFAEISETTTDFCTVQEFQLKGLLKIIAFFMPGTLKKQSIKYLIEFKVYCEGQ